MDVIPLNEAEIAIQQMEASPEVLSSASVKNIYASLGLQVISDPADSQVSDLVITALKKRCHTRLSAWAMARAATFYRSMHPVARQNWIVPV